MSKMGLRRKLGPSLARSSPSAEVYYKGLVESLKKIGCTADGAPYVISGLIRNVSRPAADQVLLDDRFEGYPSQEAEVAAAFLDEAKCPGARGLSEENKAKLQQIRDRGPARAGPSAAAR